MATLLKSLGLPSLAAGAAPPAAAPPMAALPPGTGTGLEHTPLEPLELTK